MHDTFPNGKTIVKIDAPRAINPLNNNRDNKIKKNLRNGYRFKSKPHQTFRYRVTVEFI